MRKFNVNVNGNSYVVEVEEVGASASASAPVAAPAPVAAAPAPAPAAAPVAKPAGGTSLKSPMPGTILKINLNNGATVKKGDVVLVLEAMKMENDIVAPADGTLTYLVNQGATVETGTELAVIA